MVRTARYNENKLKVALQMVAEVTTLKELRQGQSLLSPALTGATLDMTAEILGLNRDRVCVLRRQFSELAKSDRQMVIGEQRGGRRRELMSLGISITLG
jgi:hypothetical protein